jgi:hypothetical protein
MKDRIGFAVNHVNERRRKIHGGGILHHRQNLFEMVYLFRRHCRGSREITICGFQVCLYRRDGLAMFCTDKELRCQFVSDIVLVGELDGVLFCLVFFIIKFAPIDDGERVFCVAELLPSEVSEWFDESGGRNSVVVEKTPTCLRNGEGVFDIGGHGDTGGGRRRLVEVSPDHGKVAVVQPLVRQVDFYTILPNLTQIPIFTNSNFVKKVV